MYLFVFDFLLLLLFETVSCCVTQTGLKLTIFVDQLPEYWDYRCVYSYAENMELRGERLTELTLDLFSLHPVCRSFRDESQEHYAKSNNKGSG